MQASLTEFIYSQSTYCVPAAVLDAQDVKKRKPSFLPWKTQSRAEVTDMQRNNSKSAGL
jgi:hypothetical protein